ncbi:MAG: GntR family transcriptional regulator [Rhodospirillaceae bacterium]|nr:GntR family transcriptional regulator [Rhodospirillaceae bacterium]
MEERIEHTTLAEKAYEKVRSGLISARFEPGEILRIRSLADEYGISATPVREALQRLVAENALELQPNKSFMVPVLSTGRFEEVRRIRCALEPMAAELACPNITRQDVKALESLVEQMDRSIDKLNMADYTIQNEKFHFFIYERSNSALLLDIIRDLWVQVAPFFNRLFQGSDYLSNSNLWHKQIVDALENGDVQKVKQGIFGDIEAAGDELRSILMHCERTE